MSKRKEKNEPSSIPQANGDGDFPQQHPTHAGQIAPLHTPESFSAEQGPRAVRRPPPVGLKPPAGFPMATKIPLDFPPELVAALQKARDSEGKYMVVVWTEREEAGNSIIVMDRTTGGAFSYDWLLRSMALLREWIMAAEPPKGTASGTTDSGGVLAEGE